MRLLHFPIRPALGLFACGMAALAMAQPACAEKMPAMDHAMPSHSGPAPTSPAPTSPALLTPAPAFVAPLLDGGPFDLAAARGHVVVVHLWASWCPPCRAEMPILSHYAATHREVMVVGLSFDTKRDRRAVAQAMAGLAFPTALAAHATVNGFGTPALLPQTLVIDRGGRITARFAGEPARLNEAALASAVNAARALP